MTKSKDLLLVVAAYLACLIAAALYLFSPALSDLRTNNLLLDTFIADIIATTVIFVFSRYFNNSSFYDAYWSVIPPLIFHFWLMESDRTLDLSTIIVGAVIWYWALRLTWNWTKHWEGLKHEDWRYIMLKENNPKLEILVDYFGIHFFPTVQVFLGLVPIYIYLLLPETFVLPIFILAAITGFGASTIQLISDRQLHNFISIRKSGQIINHGLWKYSRHPNYFGELLFWLSLALFGIAALPSEFYYSLIGFVAMLMMFVFASIPMMEKRSLERRPQYQDIIDTTSMLLLLPPKKNN